MWIVAVIAVGIGCAYIGFLAGRDGAERRAECTIADLRIALKRALASERSFETERQGRPE